MAWSADGRGAGAGLFDEDADAPVPSEAETEGRAARRARERAARGPGLLSRLWRAVRVVAVCLLVLWLLGAAGWRGWTGMSSVRSGEGVAGTLVVADCGSRWCVGAFTADEARGAGAAGAAPGEDAPPGQVRIERSVLWDGVGARVPVVVDAAEGTAVRAGTAGVAYAWLPLAGALLLVGVLCGGGLGRRFLGWSTGLLGVAGLVAIRVLAG
ncbi:hypothetical protein [Allostreptomyces psammosilenae]|uniref:Uncharacterized protein n=1 Tax=Allostreptomyces psammosilenae TaxID=1892865 RepID=A0A852ZWD7_9ACTN|nr:hypothetical protein [Allostreptomyces psammosilenae]NYI05987.1 hypothetical protein [Allostreptomyces psammosilenae]